VKTKRIRLRKFTNNDVNLIYQLDSDADVMRYITLGIPKTIKEAKEYLSKRILESYSSDNDFGIFAAFLIKNNEFIGWFLFEKDKEVHPNLHNIKNVIEIGWRLRKEYWGRGYATEIAIALVDKAKKMKRSVVAHTMIENQASIRVMEKAGLSFVKEFWGNYEPHSNKPDVLYKKIH